MVLMYSLDLGLGSVSGSGSGASINAFLTDIRGDRLSLWGVIYRNEANLLGHDVERLLNVRITRAGVLN